MKISKILPWIVILILIAVMGYFGVRGESPPFEGVTVGNEYYATTTKPYHADGVDRVIRAGWGTLGSITITGAGAMDFALFDATSTVNTIDGFPTSTRMLAHIPAATVAGTYVFDVQYTQGLSLHYLTVGTGTSTISYR